MLIQIIRMIPRTIKRDIKEYIEFFDVGMDFRVGEIYAYLSSKYEDLQMYITSRQIRRWFDNLSSHQDYLAKHNILGCALYRRTGI